MGFLDRVKAALGMGGANAGREEAAAEEATGAAPGGGVPPETQGPPEPVTGVAQKGTAATGAGTGDPAPRLSAAAERSGVPVSIRRADARGADPNRRRGSGEQRRTRHGGAGSGPAM